MDNSGLYLSQQKPIELFIDEQNSVDRQAYKTLGKIRNHITLTISSYVTPNIFNLLNIVLLLHLPK